MISARFDELNSRGEKALIAFITAGDPTIEALPDVLRALEAGGADIIEVGIPFSDPIADGPTIQASSQRALDGGVTPAAVLETLAKAAVSVPVVLMGYYNPMLRRGIDDFAADAKRAGASGFIVCDLIPEEATDWIRACQNNQLDTIFLAAPTSTDQRLAGVVAASTGFVYAVARTGVTGASSHLSTDVDGLMQRIKASSPMCPPVCVGFGISRPDHVRSVCEIADGAVVGSYLVDLLANQGIEALESAVRELKSATKP